MKYIETSSCNPLPSGVVLRNQVVTWLFTKVAIPQGCYKVVWTKCKVVTRVVTL